MKSHANNLEVKIQQAKIEESFFDTDVNLYLRRNSGSLQNMLKDVEKLQKEVMELIRTREVLFKKNLLNKG